MYEIAHVQISNKFGLYTDPEFACAPAALIFQLIGSDSTLINFIRSQLQLLSFWKLSWERLL